MLDEKNGQAVGKRADILEIRGAMLPRVRGVDISKNRIDPILDIDTGLDIAGQSVVAPRIQFSSRRWKDFGAEIFLQQDREDPGAAVALTEYLNFHGSRQLFGSRLNILDRHHANYLHFRRDALDHGSKHLAAQLDEILDPRRSHVGNAFAPADHAGDLLDQ